MPKLQIASGTLLGDALEKQGTLAEPFKAEVSDRIVCSQPPDKAAVETPTRVRGEEFLHVRNLGRFERSAIVVRVLGNFADLS